MTPVSQVSWKHLCELLFTCARSYRRVHTRIPLRCQLRQSGCSNSLGAAATPGARAVVSNSVPHRADPGPARVAGSVNGREMSR